VNLLYGRSLRRRKAADTYQAVLARHRFLEAGWYGPLCDALFTSLPQGRALDVGCGEGHFTRTLLQEGRSWIGGIDISVPAVRAAASHVQGVDFAVADAFSLPVETGSVDVVVSIFGPVVAAEVERVLTPDGVIVAVGLWVPDTSSRSRGR
jgi:23S rRNA (guanine745-N1)-methyltransferase